MTSYPFDYNYEHNHPALARDLSEDELKVIASLPPDTQRSLVYGFAENTDVDVDLTDLPKMEVDIMGDTNDRIEMVTTLFGGSRATIDGTHIRKQGITTTAIAGAAILADMEGQGMAIRDGNGWKVLPSGEKVEVI